jgi:hypothetical protein
MYITGAFLLACALASEEDHHEEDNHDEDHHEEDNHEEDNHEEDNHEEDHFWRGVFDLEAGARYSWIAGKVDGVYAYPSTKIALVVVPSTGTLTEALALAEIAGHEALEATGGCATTAHAFDVLPLSESSECALLVYEDRMYETTYLIDVPGGVEGELYKVAIYSEHEPYLFESTHHYLKDAVGNDVEPLEDADDHGDHGTSSSSSSSSTKRARAWRNSILASFVVLACTGVGAITRVPLMKNLINGGGVQLCFSAFAVGALLAAAFFLAAFEGVHLIGAGWQNEAQATWRFGTMALAGYAVGCIRRSAPCSKSPSTTNSTSPRAPTTARCQQRRSRTAKSGASRQTWLS